MCGRGRPPPIPYRDDSRDANTFRRIKRLLDAASDAAAAADKVGARDLAHPPFQSRGQTTNGLAVSALRREQTLWKAVLKRCDSPWRLCSSPSVRGRKSDGDRRFGFDVRMVLRGNCRRGLFMLDRLPDHLELTSPCAGRRPAAARVARDCIDRKWACACCGCVVAWCGLAHARFSHCRAAPAHGEAAAPHLWCTWSRQRWLDQCKNVHVGPCGCRCGNVRLPGVLTDSRRPGRSSLGSPGRREAGVQRALVRTLRCMPRG